MLGTSKRRTNGVPDMPKSYTTGFLAGAAAMAATALIPQTAGAVWLFALAFVLAGAAFTAGAFFSGE